MQSTHRRIDFFDMSKNLQILLYSVVFQLYFSWLLIPIIKAWNGVPQKVLPYLGYKYEVVVKIPTWVTIRRVTPSGVPDHNPRAGPRLPVPIWKDTATAEGRKDTDRTTPLPNSLDVKIRIHEYRWEKWTKPLNSFENITIRNGIHLVMSWNCWNLLDNTQS